MAALDFPQINPVDAAEARFAELLDVVGQRAGRLVSKTQTHVGRWRRELQAGTRKEEEGTLRYMNGRVMPEDGIALLKRRCMLTHDTARTTFLW